MRNVLKLFPKTIFWIGIISLGTLIILYVINGDCTQITKDKTPFSIFMEKPSIWRCKLSFFLDKVYKFFSVIMIIFYLIWYFLLGKYETDNND